MVKKVIKKSAETPEKKKKEYKFEIWDVLKKIDTKQFDYYSGLPDEDKKHITPLVLMRWMTGVSASADVKEFHITRVNDYVNDGFWELTKHPELQWKLLCAAGSSHALKHEWIPGSPKVKTSKIDNLLLVLNPTLNSTELKIIKSKLTRDKLYNLMRDRAWSDKEMKPLLDEFDERER